MELRTRCLAVALGLLASCSGGGGGSSGSPGGTGSLELLATDDPFAYEFVEEARISVAEIEVRGPHGFVSLHSGAPITIDLLHLRNGVTQQLVHSDLPAGDYDQIRLVIDGGYLRLIDGDEFSTVLGNLHLTSTGTSGLKLNVDPPLQVTDGVARSVLLDFDLTKTFKAVPGNAIFDANFYQLHPVVAVTNLSQAGELRGVVREDDGTGTPVGVADATVFLLAPGELDLDEALRTTATESDGSYAFLGVEPGTYDVVAQLGAAQDRVDDQQVAAGSVTIVDFVLQ